MDELIFKYIDSKNMVYESPLYPKYQDGVIGWLHPEKLDKYIGHERKKNGRIKERSNIRCWDLE